jgi:hypothetical protein
MGVALPPSVLPDISPSRGEIRWGAVTLLISVECSVSNAVLGQGESRVRISPLEGEMPGRTEGGKATRRRPTHDL